MKICYVPRSFAAGSAAIIKTANQIMVEYARQGYDITLRQLYYQFVARGFIANKDSEYKRLGGIISDARLAGLIDWDHIVDRTRNLESEPHWGEPADMMETCAKQFSVDKWEDQPYYVEVWVEKDALKGVIGQSASALDCPYFSCRGYTSQSEVWSAAMRLLKKIRAGKKVRVIHLGDHDPSGKDMTRDIEDRLQLFIVHHLIRDEAEIEIRKRYPKLAAASYQITTEKITEDDRDEIVKMVRQRLREFVPEHLQIERIALNMDQIEQYNPPPNPAKITDSRASKYIAEFGGESWELDALEPTVLGALIDAAVLQYRDEDLWAQAQSRQDAGRETLQAISNKWGEVEEFVK